MRIENLPIGIQSMHTLRTIFLMLCFFAYEQVLQAAPTEGYVIEWGWHLIDGANSPAKLVLSNAIAVSASRFHCLALKNDGTVVRWTSNLGAEDFFANEVGTTDDGSGGGKPSTTYAKKIITNGIVRINGQVLSNVLSVASGRNFSLALKKDGTLVTWGENYVPAGLTNIAAIAAASCFSLALRNDGTVAEWDSEKSLHDYGQLHEVPIGSNVIAVAIGETYQGTRNIALKKNGTVVRWGSNYDNDFDTPPVGLSNVVAVAAGNGHTLALKSDGTVIGWGGNNVGQATGIPDTNFDSISSGQVMYGGHILSNIVSVAANDNYSMALRSDGTIVAWGRMVNDQYPATIPEGLSNVVAISAGYGYSLAITTNAAVAEKFRQKN
jgi:alpha-tubulin suppressor-like RCC1 family protein